MPISNLKHKILPIVKVINGNDKANNSEETIKFSEANEPVYKKYIGDLAIFFGIDTGQYFQLLMKKQIPKNFDTSLLLETSNKNLLRRLEGKVQFSENESGICAFVSDHDFTAALIISNMYLDFAKDKLEDNLILAAPSKDLLLFIPESNASLIDVLRQEIIEIQRIAQKPLSNILFRYDGESLTEYDRDQT